MSAIAEQIIRDLCDRAGFDDWWYSVPEDVQAEIIAEIRDTLEVFLPKR